MQILHPVAFVCTTGEIQITAPLNILTHVKVSGVAGVVKNISFCVKMKVVILNATLEQGPLAGSVTVRQACMCAK